MSMDDKADGSLLLTSEEVELPSTLEGVLLVLRRILSKPFVESIRLDVGQPIRVRWHRDVSDSLNVPEHEESVDHVLGRVDMEEYTSAAGSVQSLFEATFHANQEGLHVTHMLVGKVSFLKDWLGLPKVVGLRKYEGTEYLLVAGVRTLEVSSLPEDAVILLASEIRDATRTEVSKAYRITT